MHVNSRSAINIALLFLFCAAGCSLVPGRGPKHTEKGIAAWYGNEFHGRRTASGEIFDQWAMTAAHKRLPFNTIVLVKNLKNGRTLKVRINDRGPYTRGRIIDLSRGAARKLGMVSEGVVPVRIEVIRWGNGR